MHTSADEELQERFTREAKTLAKLSHPNIPAIYDVKLLDDEILIYFEFIEGVGLGRLQRTLEHATRGRVRGSVWARVGNWRKR